MPRFNVKNKDGLWACFSTIVDDFITDFMPQTEYESWRDKEYGNMYKPKLEDSNVMPYEEAMQTYLCQHKVEIDWDKVDEYESPCDYCKHWRDKNCRVVEDYEKYKLISNT